MSKKNLLEITTEIQRCSVTIDGQSYEVISVDELAIADYHRFGRKGLRIDFLMGKDTPTDEELAEVSKILDELCRAVLQAPDEVHRKLTEGHRLSLVKVFTREVAGNA